LPTPDLVTASPTAYGYHVLATTLQRNRRDGSVYVATSSLDPRYPNQIIAFAPDAPQAAWTVRVGSGPEDLGFDVDGDTLYVGLYRAAAVMPVDLDTRTAGERFRLGVVDFWGPVIARQLGPVPGNPDAVLVVGSDWDAASGSAGVHIYENGVELYPAANGDPAEWIIDRTADYTMQPSSAVMTGPTTLYAEGHRLWQLELTPSGFDLVTEHEQPYPGDNWLEYVGGKIFVSSGHVLEPSPSGPVVLGQVPASGPRAISDDGSRVYVVYQGSPGGNYELRCFDSATFTQTGSVAFQTLAGDPPGELVEDLLGDYELWGDDGLVLRIYNQGVVLLPHLFRNVPGCD
jgi:hypothetical protein